jgi:hypothetical protein
MLLHHYLDDLVNDGDHCPEEHVEEVLKLLSLVLSNLRLAVCYLINVEFVDLNCKVSILDF